MENYRNNFLLKNKLRTEIQFTGILYAVTGISLRILGAKVYFPLPDLFSKAPPTADRNNFPVRSRLLVFSANTEKALQKCLETLNDSPLFCGAVSSAKTTDRRQEFVNPGTCRFDFAVTQSVFKKLPRFFRL